MAITNKLGSDVLDQTILSIPTEGKDVTVTEGVTFTDASYDLATDTLYSDFVKEDGSNPDTFESKGNSVETDNQWVSDAAHNVIYGIVWNYTFAYKFGNDITKNYDLMFSPLNSSLKDSNDTGAGLRIALFGEGFDNNTKTNAIVFANKNYDTDATNHISKVGENKEVIKKTDYKSLYIASGSKDKNLTDKQGYFGTFSTTTANTDATNVVHVVAWFEGTDKHVVSSQNLSQVSAKLGFKAVQA